MMIRCNSKKTSMQAEHFMYINNSRIHGEYLVQVKCIYAPPPQWLRLLSVLRWWVLLLLIVTHVVGV